MNHLSLFSGIGGFDLAAQWMGWENIAHCEINPFCRRILSHYWPEAASHSDIKTTDFSIYNGAVDIISGGFPCQPYSTAGLRKGKEDSRHLWPEMLRAIREISPHWVVGENVRGLTNWNGGVVFDEVQADLEAEGYEVLPFLLPACAVNAPHRRDRIWFVAFNTGSKPNDGSGASGRGKVRLEVGGNLLQETERQKGTDNDKSPSIARTSSDTHGKGLEGRTGVQNPHLRRSTILCQKGDWRNFPTFSPICSRNDGFPGKLAYRSLSGWRNESIKAYGNAIVPQVALQIFKAIEQYETETLHQMRH